MVTVIYEVFLLKPRYFHGDRLLNCRADQHNCLTGKTVGSMALEIHNFNDKLKSKID
jgi:hypothetical protein